MSELGELEPNPHQPRHHFDEARLKELADSMKESGLLQPIIVKKNGSKYQIIAGERRWRAAQIAGLEKVPNSHRDDGRETFARSVVENIHRQDLTSGKENAIYDLWQSHDYATHAKLTLGHLDIIAKALLT